MSCSSVTGTRSIPNLLRKKARLLGKKSATSFAAITPLSTFEEPSERVGLADS